MIKSRVLLSVSDTGGSAHIVAVREMMRSHSFEQLKIEDDEIILIKNGEPFSIREYKKGTVTYLLFKYIQSLYDREII